MAIIPPFFLDTVVALGLSRPDGSIQWVGTGFFVSRMVDDKGGAIVFLVTNRHVVKDQKQMVVRLKNKTDNKLVNVGLPLKDADGTSRVKFHTNPKIDIAVVQINGKYLTENNLQIGAFDLEKHSFDTDQLRAKDVDEGSLIYMLGYPMGIVDEDSNTPICRLGCIARMSESKIQKTNCVLIDIQNFPGNSGSPIIIRPEPTAIKGTKPLNESALIGIVHSYIPYEEQLINSQTKRVVEIRSENSGLAYMHPVQFIRQIIDPIAPAYAPNP